MKPIYKSLVLANMALAVTLSLQANVTSDGTSTPQAVNAETLEGLKVELVAPNMSGARDLIASGECVIDGANLAITLNTANWIKGATYRVQVLATFGTQTMVIYALDVTVPRYVTMASGTQEYADNVVVVSTFGDGDTSGADASVYAKDGEGNAHITKPLSIGYAGDGATIRVGSNGAIASGYAGEGATIQADGDGAIASGSANGAGATIRVGSDGAIASGSATGDGATIQADGSGAIASGYASSAGATIQADGSGAIAIGSANGAGATFRADGDGAIAIGSANGAGATIHADGDGAIASGYADTAIGNVEATGTGSQAFGIGVKATQDGQMVVGKCNVVDEDDTFAFIVGNGADDEHRHNAFGVTKSGSLALFKADGTAVMLTATQLEALIALLQNA